VGGGFEAALPAAVFVAGALFAAVVASGTPFFVAGAVVLVFVAGALVLVLVAGAVVLVLVLVEPFAATTDAAEPAAEPAGAAAVGAAEPVAAAGLGAGAPATAAGSTPCFASSADKVDENPPAEP
jgi:hypothetical protein